MCAKSVQSYLTLCYPMDYSPPMLLCPWGLSRQEYWSGLPRSSPRDRTHISYVSYIGMWVLYHQCNLGSPKWYLTHGESDSVNHSVVFDSLQPHELYTTRLECPGRHHATLSMEFSRLEYWSGQPFLSPGDLPDPGIESRYPALKADSLPSEPPGKPIWHVERIQLFLVICAVQASFQSMTE